MAMAREPIDWRYLLSIRPIFQAYVRRYPHKNMARNMVRNLHFRILELGNQPQMALVQVRMGQARKPHFRLVNITIYPDCRDSWVNNGDWSI